MAKGVRLDHGDASARESLYAEAYHPQHLAKNPNGYCEIGGRGVAFRNRVSGVPEALKIIVASRIPRAPARASIDSLPAESPLATV